MQHEQNKEKRGHEQYNEKWEDYYKILQIVPLAEPEVIEGAYKRLAQKYHPDTSKDSKSPDRMTKINEAYEVLSNPNRRSAYDEVFKTKYQGKEADQTIKREPPHAPPKPEPSHVPPKVAECSLPLEQAFSQMNRDEIEKWLLKHADEVYEQREKDLGADNMRRLERWIMLRTIDKAWVEHLTSMEQMRQSAGLEAIGQRDPLVIYKQRGHTEFAALTAGIEHDVATTIFNNERIEKLLGIVFKKRTPGEEMQKR